MKELTGSPKQVKWAEEIREEYIKNCKYLGEEPVDTESAKFWIEHGRVSNIRLKDVPIALEAWNYLNKNGIPTRQDVKKGEITNEAYNLIAHKRIKI